MRIEAGQHAVDRLGDELLVLDGFDVVALYASEDLGEGAQLLDGQRCRAAIALGDRRVIEADRDADEHTDDDQSELAEFVTHYKPPNGIPGWRPAHLRHALNVSFHERSKSWDRKADLRASFQSINPIRRARRCCLRPRFGRRRG